MARKRKPPPSAYQRPGRDAALLRLAGDARRKRAEADRADAERWRRRAASPAVPAPPRPPETAVRAEAKQSGDIFSGYTDTPAGAAAVCEAG